MVLAVQVLAVFLMAVAMSLALAHALEHPGKLRLEQRDYIMVQGIYYPGFTVAGIAEPLAAIATLILLLLLKDEPAALWWAVVALVAVVAMHAVFWLVTQPVNRIWVRQLNLSKAGSRFFAVNAESPHREAASDWKHLRDRWEYSHILRAILSAVGLIALVVAVSR